MPFPYPALCMAAPTMDGNPDACTELALAAQSDAKERTAETAAATGLESLQGHQQNHPGGSKDLKNKTKQKKTKTP